MSSEPEPTDGHKTRPPIGGSSSVGLPPPSPPTSPPTSPPSSPSSGRPVMAPPARGTRGTSAMGGSISTSRRSMGGSSGGSFSGVGLPPRPGSISGSVSTSIPPSGGGAPKKKMTKEEMRVLIVRELVSTEETYVSQLLLLRDLFVVPIRERGIIKPKQHSVLFSESDLNSIILLNSQLLKDLRALVYDAEFIANGGGAGDISSFVIFDPLSTCIAPLFLDFVEFLKMYTQYVNRHEAGMKVLGELKSNTKFQSYLDEMQKDPRLKGLGLEALRILPIQRVPRYELFFRDLVKKTEETHPDYNDLVRAKDEISKVNASINESMQVMESMEQVSKIEQRCVPRLTLIAPARKFVAEAQLVKVSRKKDIRYNFVLFSDCLLYCTETEVGKGQLKWHHLLHFDKFFRVVDITAPNKKYGYCCFEIHSTVKSFLVYTGTPTVKKEWLDMILDCLETLRKNREDIVKDGSETATMHGLTKTQPVWFPDDFSDICMVPDCRKKFTIVRRRHHCRYCGRLVCDACSKNKMPDVTEAAQIQGGAASDGEPEEVDPSTLTLVRVCDMCHRQYKDYFPDLDLWVRKKKGTGFFSRSGSMWDEDSMSSASHSHPLSKSPRAGDSEEDLPDDSSEDESEYSAMSSSASSLHHFRGGDSLSTKSARIIPKRPGMAAIAAAHSTHTRKRGSGQIARSLPPDSLDHRSTGSSGGPLGSLAAMKSMSARILVPSRTSKADGGSGGAAYVKHERKKSKSRTPTGSPSEHVKRASGGGGGLPPVSGLTHDRSGSRLSTGSGGRPLPPPSPGSRTSLSSSGVPGMSAHGSSDGRQYQQMVDLMKSKLETERKKTQELEREIRDLKLANDKLKKAKTDLAQSYVSQIKSLKRQLKDAHEKMKAAGIS